MGWRTWRAKSAPAGSLKPCSGQGTGLGVKGAQLTRCALGAFP